MSASIELNLHVSVKIFYGSNLPLKTDHINNLHSPPCLRNWQKLHGQHYTDTGRNVTTSHRSQNQEIKLNWNILLDYEFMCGFPPAKLIIWIDLINWKNAIESRRYKICIYKICIWQWNIICAAPTKHSTRPLPAERWRRW